LGISALAVGTVLGSVTKSAATDDTVLKVVSPEQGVARPLLERRAARSTRGVERSAVPSSVIAHRAAALSRQHSAIASKEAVLKHKEAVKKKKREAAKRKRAAAAERLGYRIGTSNPRSIARQIMKNKYGWGKSEFSCYNNIIMRESMWAVKAENPGSGAYGIPQALPGSKMASAGKDWRTNPATQINWGLGYVKDRYGTPCSAWGFKSGHGWY
jgi:hypothetical protein